MSPANGEHITAGAVRTALRALVKQHGTQRAAAKYLGISHGYLHDLLNGRRGDVNGPGPKVLEALGLMRETRVIRRPGA